ncbi:hypothetical protein [Phenylobacterium sp.]|uniref:hypothetical protein n=1 Tax=Phenylobacterium sp. TaxID=1871053 RepID=UPI003D28C32F
MPHSTVVAQVSPGGVQLVADLPISELKAATDDRPAADAGDYILRHADIVGADGRTWRKRASAAEAGARDGVAVMTVTVTFTAPPGGAVQARRLRYDAILHRIASHVVRVYRREGEALIPMSRLQSPTIELDLP